MAKARAEWTDHLEACWRISASGVLPALFLELRSAGVYKSFQFDTFSDLDEDGLEEELAAILRRVVTDDEVRQFRVLVELADGSASRKRQRVNSWAASLGELTFEEPTVKLTERELLSVKLKGPAILSSVSFPTSSSKPRESKEDKRKKLALTIGAILMETGMPAGLMVAGSSNPDRLLSRFAGGKRTSTLQGRISTYKAMKVWMQANHGKVFPTREHEVLDYILDRVAEPCGPSIPGQILGTITFLETAGGKPSGTRLSESSVIMSTKCS